MTEERLKLLLQRFKELSILVVGDFFLDKYFIMDRKLSEVSLETGLEAYQVMGKQLSPGAAGTVTSNLRALSIGTVYALGIVGNDGEGYELKQGLIAKKVDTTFLIDSDGIFTPTYTKPMMIESDGRVHELNRLDIKNRKPLSRALEERIINNLRQAILRVNGVIIADQVQERNYGVITDLVRKELAELALKNPHVVFFVDSRTRIGDFREVIIKPNKQEAIRAFEPDYQGEFDRQKAEGCGWMLFERNRKPVYLTLGAEGIALFADEGYTHIPAIPVTGEIDIVGAGDSTSAGIVSSLCAGADYAEAALIGNLVASITIQQIGTTGTASPEQVMERFRSLI